MSPEHWAVSAALVVTSALALIANALLLLVFFRRRGLRTVSNRFVINLLITNLLSSLVLIPLLLVDQEFQSPNEQFSMHQNLILKGHNTSSHLTIENIQLQIEEDRQNNQPNALFQTTPFISDLQILEEDFEVEILNFKDANLETRRKIRHHDHLVRKRNLTERVVGQNVTYDEDLTTALLCYISLGSTTLVCTASILSILLISIDQYFAVTHPLRYHAFIDKFKSLILLVTTWLISLLFSLLGAFVQTDSSVWNFCLRTNKNKNSDFQHYYNIVYAFTYLILVILVPFVVICVIYGCIYCAAHRNSERMRKSNSGSSNTNLDAYIQIPLDENRLRVKVNSSDNVTIEQGSDVPRLPKVKSAPNFANLDKIKPSARLSDDVTASVKVCHAHSLRSNASFIMSLKTKISNASLFKYREETRAAKISILVIFMVLVCYMPYGLTLILNAIFYDDISSKTSSYFNCFSLSLLVLANLLSPFLFAYRNRRIQRELRRLFGLLPKKNGREMTIVRERTFNKSCVYKPKDTNEITTTKEPFLQKQHVIPEVVVTCKVENEKKSILKRVCSKGKTWGATKKCNFISVPECLSVECRCSFSSASTQVSSEEYSVCN